MFSKEVFNEKEKREGGGVHQMYTTAFSFLLFLRKDKVNMDVMKRKTLLMMWNRVG